MAFEPSGGVRRLIVLVRELGPALFLIILCGWFALTIPAFLSPGNIRDVLVQISAIAISAAGMTFVIITAGIDLSVGSVLALSGCVGALAGLKLSHSGIPWIVDTGLYVPLGFAAGLATGALAGLINGLMMTKFQLPPFIMTLGTMSIARGLAFTVTNNSPVEVVGGMRRIAATPESLPIPTPIVLLVIVYAACWFILRYTRVGRYTYAIGGNEEATRLSGVPIHFYLIVVYVLCGLLAGLSGLIMAGRIAYMQPQAGEGFELEVIAAVVIGGTSLAGGRGSLIATLVGALIMGVVKNGLNLMSVNYNLQKVIIGIIIIVAVAVDVLAKRYTEKQ